MENSLINNAEPLSFEAKVSLFSKTVGFENLPEDACQSLARIARSKRFVKNAIIFSSGEPCRAFYVAAGGLVRVSVYSATGKRLTYLLAKYGEPLNLVGPFTGAARLIEAEVIDDSVIVSIKREDFLDFAFKHPQVIISIITILGQAVDSANTRVIDMIDRKVEYRLMRVLFSLYKKFGATLNFTASELADLTGTTTESSLRALSRLREKRIIETGRRQIQIIDPDALNPSEIESLWF